MLKTWHHEGVEHLRSVVKQKFPIRGLKNAMRSVKCDCVQRKKLTRIMDPQMSHLQASRLEGMIYP